MSQPIRLVLADDHPIFRKGIRLVLEEARMAVVAEAEDGPRALARIEEHRPDVAIIDLDMPGLDGLAVAREVQQQRWPVKVVIITGHRNDALVQKVLDEGPLGFVLKDGAVTEIVECVQAVHAGRHYISPSLSSALLARRAAATALATERDGLARLSPTERRVLVRVAQGRTSRDIADEFCVSVRTVEHHRANVAEKLGLQGSNALVKFAIAHRQSLINE